MSRRHIGLLGGTFDPVHVGHLALAHSACVAFKLDEMRLIATGAPWQKSGVIASPVQRLAMLRLAIAGDPRLQADPREVERAGPTYTVDTLAQLRAELGPEVSLILILGSDQLRNLASWHRWRELLQHAHLACTQREQVPLADLPAPVEALVQAHGAQALPDAPAGSIVFFTMPPLPVSATSLRQALARGERPADFVPPAVFDYIE
ncbi:MAG: nicotinate-nucleotide adenylyltransferase, partial [Burkholderiaceae bacterium]|nr:nicotinate-nucleotide adenylyltransferase [Burkholderiaceae bacterium]